jgi:hypothetical protein
LRELNDLVAPDDLIDDLEHVVEDEADRQQIGHQQVGLQRLAIRIQRSAVLEDEMLVRIFGQEEAQITLSFPCRQVPHDPEQRLKLLIHRLDGFRRFVEIKSMHDAVRTSYGDTMCRRPPDGGDLPPHYKHGRLSRPQRFAGAATVACATDLDTKKIKVFSDNPH